MVDSIMYQQDGYVVLESNHLEELMREEELLAKLETVLKQTEELPADISKFATVAQQAKYMLENYCEFNYDNGNYLQWYLVRWEKG